MPGIKNSRAFRLKARLRLSICEHRHRPGSGYQTPKMALESPDGSAAMINERPVYFDKKSYTTAVYERTF
ncbi:MAG: hypothetical protein Ct9H300mP14_02880 [Gammaproteobacteria bacterium]|nr:MAG: hypothetical protein Ct9H300mP14_02880 [Gammaproteobacteria bacterium]